ncbi:MAG: pseudouridine synthase [Xanthobacteraceae bacterium]|nr:pseudouridine synthase [Xanthobacteraceae bacterium]
MNSESDHKHRGRKFRGKRLRTRLPRPAADAPLPERKDAERIAKVIARAGLASRREAEAWIEAGRVSVNGAVIRSPALNVGTDDRIAVDGKPLPQRERTRLFLFHKPRGLVTTSADPEGRPTIFGALPKDLPRVVTVGRLDMNTEGLLLLTNDGGLARALELPATGWLRRYRVRAYGKVLQPRLDALRNGIEVDGIRYGAIEATLDREQGDNSWITFAMREGKNREIRNVLGALGLKVNRLIRLSYGPFQLGELPAGAVEEIKTRALREQLGERLAAMAGADFSGPIVEREVEPEPQTPSERRHPEARAQRASGSQPWPTSAPKDRSRANPTSAGDGPDRSERPSRKGTLPLPDKQGRGRSSFPPPLAARATAGQHGAPKRDSAKAGEGRLRRPPQDDREKKRPRGENRDHRGHRGGRPHRGKRPR